MSYKIGDKVFFLYHSIIAYGVVSGLETSTKWFDDVLTTTVLNYRIMDGHNNCYDVKEDQIFCSLEDANREALRLRKETTNNGQS